MRDAAYYKAKLREYQIPEYMHEGLIEYITQRRPTGDFLTAVLSNDLFAAVNYADGNNQRVLPEYVKFLYSHAPQPCWHSVEKVQEWLYPTPIDLTGTELEFDVAVAAWPDSFEHDGMKFELLDKDTPSDQDKAVYGAKLGWATLRANVTSYRVSNTTI